MICLDTHVLIWRLGKYARATPGQEEMVDRAERYIEYLQREKIEIMIPTPVLAEYLVGATAQERQEAEVFDIATEVCPFDVPAAVFAASLFRETHRIEEMVEEHNIAKDCIKVDIMIAAIAVTRKAQKLITEDVKLFKTLVKNQIPVERLPDRPRPGRPRSGLSLFD